ncbi:MAG: type II toxin-antitoxin system VapC family toxin [Thermoplasmata archaeon]
MVCLETTFLIDLLNGKMAALAKAEELDSFGERQTVTPIAASELLFGAYLAGGDYLHDALSLLDNFTLLSFDLKACQEAGEIHSELRKRGEVLGTVDVLIAAICRRHRERLITRDKAFAGVPGLPVETY